MLRVVRVFAETDGDVYVQTSIIIVHMMVVGMMMMPVMMMMMMMMMMMLMRMMMKAGTRHVKTYMSKGL